MRHQLRSNRSAVRLPLLPLSVPALDDRDLRAAAEGKKGLHLCPSALRFFQWGVMLCCVPAALTGMTAHASNPGSAGTICSALSYYFPNGGLSGWGHNSNWKINKGGNACGTNALCAPLRR